MTDFHGINIQYSDTGGRNIQTQSTSVIAVVGTAPEADTNKVTSNLPLLINKSSQATIYGNSGSIPIALQTIYQQNLNPLIVVVKVSAGSSNAETIANIAGNKSLKTGVFALLNAESILKQKPKILIAPFFDSILNSGNTANGIATNLLLVAESLRAIAVINGPNTTNSDVITYAQNLASDRLYMIDPYFIPSFTAVDGRSLAPASPLAAATIAKQDMNNGFWCSPSNTALSGVASLNRPVDKGSYDSPGDANLLNQAGVATLITSQGTFKLWGNRTTSQDIKWNFLSVRRTADAVYDALEKQLEWAEDKTFSATLVETIELNVQRFLNQLIAKGALLGGTVTFDKAINSKEELASGKVTINFDFEPPAPLEQLTLIATRNGSYYEEAIKNL